MDGVEGDCPMDEEIDLNSLKCYSSPDVLICGNCRFALVFVVVAVVFLVLVLILVPVLVLVPCTCSCSSRMVFSSLHDMVSHKRHYCKLRFTCKCEDEVRGIPLLLRCHLHLYQETSSSNGTGEAPPPFLRCR